MRLIDGNLQYFAPAPLFLRELSKSSKSLTLHELDSKFCVLSTFLIAVGGASEASGGRTCGSLFDILLFGAERSGIHGAAEILDKHISIVWWQNRVKLLLNGFKQGTSMVTVCRPYMRMEVSRIHDTHTHTTWEGPRHTVSNCNSMLHVTWCCRTSRHAVQMIVRSSCSDGCFHHHGLKATCCSSSGHTVVHV
jgi:hypothetical protein